MDNKVLQDVVIAPDDNWSGVLAPRQSLRIPVFSTWTNFAVTHPS